MFEINAELDKVKKWKILNKKKVFDINSLMKMILAILWVLQKALSSKSNQVHYWYTLL